MHSCLVMGDYGYGFLEGSRAHSSRTLQLLCSCASADPLRRLFACGKDCVSVCPVSVCPVSLCPVSECVCVSVSVCPVRMCVCGCVCVFVCGCGCVWWVA